MRQRGFGEIKESENIRAKNSFDAFRFEVFHAIDFVLLARVVDQNVNPAKSIQRSFNDFFAKIRLGDVAFKLNCPPTDFLDSCRRQFGIVFFIEADDTDVRAFLGKLNGDGTSDAAVPAGDDW